MPNADDEKLDRLDRLFPPREFTCPDCGRTTHNPHDAEQRYCSACKKFFEDKR